MGAYLNPGNNGYREILQSEYVDKTGLIALINHTLGTREKLSCISRPRRFGKSYAAKMLCAYYDCSCDSRELFDDKKIARSRDYLTHLNQYHVISLDITGFISSAIIMDMTLSNVPNMMADAVCRELTESYPELEGKSLADTLIGCVEKSGKKFVFVIDEWDALIREEKGDTMVQKKYLNSLRGWFKNNNFTSRVVAAAYMTGILPIKKDGSQSAISDFKEMTILNPGRLAEFTGFTERDARSLCGKYGMDFEGLQETISRLISGDEVEVDTDFFENDFESFKSRDDVLTLLIHLGYLSWNEEEGTARIPNEEVRIEFQKILKGTNVKRKWMELLGRSKKLLEDTIAGDAQAVAEAIEEIRDSQYAPTYYNDEQALRYVIKFAYIAAIEQYLKVEELPSGKGIADVVYLPKRRSTLPALVVELKWNKSSEGAIRQVKERISEASGMMVGT